MKSISVLNHTSVIQVIYYSITKDSKKQTWNQSSKKCHPNQINRRARRTSPKPGLNPNPRKKLHSRRANSIYNQSLYDQDEQVLRKSISY